MTHAWRLTFGYDGDDYALISARRLVKRIPPGQAARPDDMGRYIELRDPHRKVLYRRHISELTPETLEYPTGDPARPLGRVTARRGREVALLVPALPEGRTVAIVAASGRRKTDSRSAAQGESGAGSVRELIAVDLPREGEEK